VSCWSGTGPVPHPVFKTGRSRCSRAVTMQLERGGGARPDAWRSVPATRAVPMRRNAGKAQKVWSDDLCCQESAHRLAGAGGTGARPLALAGGGESRGMYPSPLPSASPPELMRDERVGLHKRASVAQSPRSRPRCSASIRRSRSSPLPALTLFRALRRISPLVPAPSSSWSSHARITTQAAGKTAFALPI
jgi:hypothetical protein